MAWIVLVGQFYPTCLAAASRPLCLHGECFVLKVATPISGYSSHVL